MSKHLRLGALAAVAVTGLAVGATLAVPADAGSRAAGQPSARLVAQKQTAPKKTPKKTPKPSKPLEPAFLAPEDLPPHAWSGWYADPVAKGVPEQLLGCLTRALPPGGVHRHRAFRTELDTGAVQLTVVTGNDAKAGQLAARLDRAMRTCAAYTERRHPGTEATYRSYGKVRVEEGARVHGLHTETSYGADDVHLVGIGRDGRTVTVVQWGELGDLSQAPVKAFERTTATAVKKLY
jgi:hypothetical protein